jgi:hypothetical protein
VLPDGTLILADYREHYRTRQATGFTQWEVETWSDREVELCREIASSQDTKAFDDEVRRYYDEQVAPTDGPLPPLEWGDRLWHMWEKQPDD